MTPAPRHALQAAALLTLTALAAPVAGAQRAGLDSLLVAGNTIRFRTGEPGARMTEAVIVARRGDTLEVRVRAQEGTTPTASERSLAWRTLPRLDARRADATDGNSDGALIGVVLGASIGIAAAKPSSGALDLSPMSNPGLLAVAGGLLGGLVGFMVDASSDGRAWVRITPP